VQTSGKDLFPARPFEVPCWNYPEHYGYSREEVNAVWATIKADPTFWQNLPVYPTTLDDISYLEKLKQVGHNVYFITNRMGVRAKLQTERWLRRKGFEGPTVLLTAHKGLAARTLELTHYIDDRWENVLDVATTNTQTFVMDRPWNRGDYAMNITGQSPIIRVSRVSDLTA
jgi:hypothetical protein